MLTARRRHSLLAAIVVVATLAAGSAWAAGKSGSARGGTITGCYAADGGALRVVSSRTRCKAGEIRVTWQKRGAKGKPGVAGPIGPKGDAGPAGANGEAGGAGPQGPAGPQGLSGTQGETGPRGPAGPQGIPGTEGLTGATGRTGATGSTGATGATGRAGTTGAPGVQGNPGVQGTPGAAGKSQLAFGGLVQADFNAAGTTACSFLTQFGPTALTATPSGTSCVIQGAGLTSGYIATVSPSTPTSLPYQPAASTGSFTVSFTNRPTSGTVYFTYLVGVPAG